MVQRAQVVALVASLAVGAAIVAGLALGSREAPVHVGPTAASARDQVDIYAAILTNLAGAGSAAAPNRIRVSRTIYDTCLPRPPGDREATPSTPYTGDPNVPPLPKNLPAPCGYTKVGQLKPDIEAALHEALAQRGIDAVFGDEGDFSLHQIVTEATGTPAADGDVGHRVGTKFHFKRIDGQWRLQGTTIEWMVE